MKRSARRTGSVAKTFWIAKIRVLVGSARLLAPVFFLLAAIFVTAVPCWSQHNPKKTADRITLVDVTSKEHLTLPRLWQTSGQRYFSQAHPLDGILP